MRACRYLLVVGLLLASLPAVAQTPATNARPGDSVTTARRGESAVAASVPARPTPLAQTHAVGGIPTPVAPEAASTPGTTVSVLSNAAAAFAILGGDGGWGRHRKPCDDGDDDDNDNNDDDRRWQRSHDDDRSSQSNHDADRRGRRHHRGKDQENCKPESKKR